MSLFYFIKKGTFYLLFVLMKKKHNGTLRMFYYSCFDTIKYK